MRFLIGTHETSWLGHVAVPLFVSARRLRKRASLPRAAGTWCLDSGAFTELSLYGGWRTTPGEYVVEVRRWVKDIGGMMWAAPQDWPCEPAVIAGGILGGRKVPGTKLSVREHQKRTTENYLLLRQMAPDVPWIPVLQGWEYQDYLDHLGQYYAAGVHMHERHTVGLGSVCRRQATGMVEELTKRLAIHHRIRLHGFGFKLTGLVRAAKWLVSADSLAWSFDARRGKPLPGCPHRKCANCLRYALAWRERALDAVARGEARPVQRELFA